MTPDPGSSIAVLGAGSWGTALAILLARNGHQVRLWGRNPQHLQVLHKERCNRRYLPGVPFPDRLCVEGELSRALDGLRDVLLVVPSHGFRATLEAVAPRLGDHNRIAWATKGLEARTGRFLHQVAEEVLGERHPTAVISGPTFATEVAAGLPTAATVASRQARFAEQLARMLHGETFRAYTSRDVLGVELGGASKNVMAIAAGITDGLGFGANSRAALITRGLAEIMRLGEAVGAQRETFMGLAGMGDLVLTCTDNQSRNRRLGLSLGRGMQLDEAVTAIGQVVEGVNTSRELMNLSGRFRVDMPITREVHHVLDMGLAPLEAAHNLLSRELKAESV